MKFQYNDGGRAAAGFSGSARDCVARSIAIVTDRPYIEIYNMLADGNANQRRSKHDTGGVKSASNGINTKRKWFKNIMRKLGYKWNPTMGIGTGCKVHLKDGELPIGRLAVQCSRHMTAVIDGVVHDTHNPTRDGSRCVYGYWTFVGGAA